MTRNPEPVTPASTGSAFSVIDGPEYANNSVSAARQLGFLYAD
jgi:hypothetical protein